MLQTVMKFLSLVGGERRIRHSPENATAHSLKGNPDGFLLMFSFLLRRCSSAPIGEKILFSPKTSFCESFFSARNKIYTEMDFLILVVRVRLEPTI